MSKWKYVPVDGLWLVYSEYEQFYVTYEEDASVAINVLNNLEEKLLSEDEVRVKYGIYP